MAKLTDVIKREAKGLKVDAEALVIEQTLNKLFYLKPDIKNEIKFLTSKYGVDSKDRYGLHASAMLASDNEFCYREQVLSLFFRQAQGENIPINLKRIFTAGDVIHEKWQRLFIRGGLGKPEAMDRSRFKREYDLSYTPDACPVVIGNKQYVVEIKSMNTFQFKNCNSHPSGEKQLKFYMWLTGIHNGFVLVDDKNDQNFKVILVPYEPADIEPYIARLERIQELKEHFKKHKKPPKRKCKGPDTKRASGCNMRDACFNVGMGRVRLCTKS